VPAAAAAKLAPLGRASLGVYAIHVPGVYGWSAFAGLAQRVGPTLPVGAALGLAVAVLAASLALHHGIVAARGGAVALARRARHRLPQLASVDRR
jgi:acyltransferase